MEWILHENLALYKCTSIAEHLGLLASLTLEKAESQTSAPINVKQARSEPLTPVSIVIPCYNEQESLPYLAKTLASVESKLNDIGYTPELIFVDDRSQDETFNVMHSLFGEHKNVQILQHEANKGVAGGIMTGIRAAKTELVCSIDCDCTFDPHKLSK